jgi:transcriptional regulator with XRE-family HTH domain
MKSLNDRMAELGEPRRRKIEARAAELVAEEMSLRDLRRAHRLTQARIGKTLRIGQDGVSRLEQRSDLLISTLRNFVEAMGGDLQLIARFPDRPAVAVTGLSGIESLEPGTPRRHAAHRPRGGARPRASRSGRRSASSR